MRTLAALAAAAMALLVQAMPSPATSVLLTDAVASKGAMCLDGSPQRYWIQKGDPTKFTIHIMGGGWCESIESCAGRAFTYIGSSNTSMFPATEPGNGIPGLSNYSNPMDFAYIPSCLGARWCGGLMINDPSRNPWTWNWTKVLIPYCDGGSFGGNNATPTTTVYNGAEVTLHFRGWSNFNAVIDDLVESQGLDAAQEVVLGGDSAGGLATYWHVDHLADRLPAARVVGVPDSGYFFQDPQYRSWSDALYWVVSYMNSTAGLNQACVSARQSAGLDPLLCAFPEVVTPYIKTPLFVMNSRYDSALDSITGGENGSNVTNVQRIGDLLLQHVNATVLNRPGNAAFLTSCHEHCGQWATGQVLGPSNNPNAFDDFNVTILTGNGPSGSTSITGIPAAQAWYEGRASTNLWLQGAQYPCKTCCQGGQA